MTTTIRDGCLSIYRIQLEQVGRYAPDKISICVQVEPREGEEKRLIDLQISHDNFLLSVMGKRGLECKVIEKTTPNKS